MTFTGKPACFALIIAAWLVMDLQIGHGQTDAGQIRRGNAPRMSLSVFRESNATSSGLVTSPKHTSSLLKSSLISGTRVPVSPPDESSALRGSSPRVPAHVDRVAAPRPHSHSSAASIVTTPVGDRFASLASPQATPSANNASNSATAEDGLWEQEKSGLQRDLMRPILAVDIDISTGGKKVPTDRSPELFSVYQKDWASLIRGPGMLYQWEAPNIRYRKLYFEDVAMERYGQAGCGWWATYRSTAHWGASLISLPLKMRLDPYYDCDTPYGYCRPGEATPSLWQRHVYR